ncbi:MAG TPA: substrate-binding domain-containing protein [Clostridiales bacterium]|nr:substrate-binding domain-containing protein [Clostridiales bacterium]
MPHYPKYQAVVDYILGKIKNNELASGDRIPSEKELAEIHGVSNITIRKAMAELVDTGVIYRIKGKGSFVSDGSVHKEEQRHRLVAFLFPGLALSGNAYMQYITNMQRYLLNHGYSLIIENTNADNAGELSVVKKLIEQNVKGFIFFCEDPEKSIPSFKILDEKKIPFVLIDRYTTMYPSNYVGSNNHDGAYTAVRHLLNQGHINIAYVANNIHLSSERERYEGYKDALASAGLTVNPDFLFTTKTSSQEQLLGYIKKGMITAIVTVNDKYAIEVMKYLNQAGVSIPDDVSLVGFDDADILKDAMINLTTVKQFFNEVGYNAAKLLDEIINHKHHDFNHIRLGIRLIVRESTKFIQ